MCKTGPDRKKHDFRNRTGPDQIYLVFEPKTRFLKSIFAKTNQFLTKINEHMTFHTHFIDFGGVGTNETG